MRTKKYKFINKIGTLLLQTLLKDRFNKFKRSKWSKVKRIMQGVFSVRFCNPLELQVLKTRWERIRSFHKEGLDLYRLHTTLYGQCYSKHQIRRMIRFIKNKELLFRALIIQPFYRVDVLLWKLQFFTSRAEAVQAINANQIKINSLSVSSLVLKKGDIIEFTKFESREYVRNLRAALFLNSFLEVDYYSGVTVVLKGISEMHDEDFLFLINESLDLYKLRGYVIN